MAKGRSSRSNADGTPSSLTSLLSPTVYPQPAIVEPPLYQGWTHDTVSNLRQLEDRRTWDPDPVRTAKAVVKRGRFLLAHPSLAVGNRLQRSENFSYLRFAIPSYVAICARRKVRREVLHALERTNKRRGKGGGRKPRHRNSYSLVRC